ncbi:MAG: ATP phosphoribosyltransferase [Thiohalospira sp.]
MAEPITLALSKGRIFEETVPLLRHAGIEPAEDPDSSRRLILETNRPGVRIVIVRASDVPTYVQYGAADIGVAGKDVLMEHGGDGLYEPVDLGIAACRLMVAGRAGEAEPPRGRRRIATKYVHTTRRYYAEKGEQVEIIKLYGSMELGPLVGLADAIVDVVDTGNTLRANGLEPQEHIADISSRLVVNRAAMKVKHDTLGEIITAFREAVGGE